MWWQVVPPAVASVSWHGSCPGSATGPPPLKWTTYCTVCSTCSCPHLPPHCPRTTQRQTHTLISFNQDRLLPSANSTGEQNDLWSKCVIITLRQRYEIWLSNWQMWVALWRSNLQTSKNGVAYFLLPALMQPLSYWLILALNHVLNTVGKVKSKLLLKS